MGGWDTVFALSVEQVNASLSAGRSSLLKTFDVDLGSFKASGEFGPWQVIPGGTVEYLWLNLPIPRGTSTFDNQTKDLSGISVTMQVSLSMVPSIRQPSVEDLVFLFESEGKENAPPKKGAVTPVGYADPAGRLTPVEAALLKAGMARTLVSRRSEIAYWFATINLVPPTGPAGWLTPAAARYAYVERSPSAYLAICSVTSNRDISKLRPYVDVAMLSGEPQSAFAIADSLFLQNLILPALPEALGGDASADSFRLASNRRIVNTRSIGLPGIKEGLITYYPSLSLFELDAQDGQITVNVKGECDLKANLGMTFTVQAQYPMTFDAGNKTIGFAADPNPRSHHEAHIPWYWKFLAPVVGLITTQVVKLIARGLAERLTSQLAGLRILADVGVSTRWASMRPFVVTSAELLGNLLLKGTTTTTPTHLRDDANHRLEGERHDGYASEDVR